jgi:hypothetical protein
MSGPQFFETRMGQTYYQGTMPRIAKALEAIAKPPINPKLVEAIETCFELATGYYNEHQEQDPDVVGTWKMDIDKVERFLEANKF